MEFYFTPLLAALVALAPAAQMPEVHTKEIETHEAKPECLCSCVCTARAYGAKIPLIDAADMTVATSTASVGATALFYYPKSGLHHVAYVTLVGDGWFDILEGNYRECELTLRRVQLTDSRLLGFL
jgi:hypothetical protein